MSSLSNSKENYTTFIFLCKVFWTTLFLGVVVFNQMSLIYLDCHNKQDAEVLRELVALGAVPFCQTNVPQTMCTIQCSNPLYGETGNPWDKSRECGGSSGGEGCLIGAGGSVLGVGSDYGGSVRSPAALCGICSLRTEDRSWIYYLHLDRLSLMTRGAQDCIQ